MKKVLILGGSGMLGSMVVDYLESTQNYDLTATIRDKELLSKCQAILPRVNWINFNVLDYLSENAFNNFENYDYIINCIGITKPYCKDDNAEQIENATKINSLFPYYLGKWADKNKTVVLQIATDCVYSGRNGNYDEKDEFDPTDVYGKTKSLGEIYLNSVKNLRCSIIGPEFKTQAFLLEWVLKQENGTTINGFTNHFWNGVTTLHFAKICNGIMKNDVELNHIQHIIAGNILSKFEMVSKMAKSYNKEINVNPVDTPASIDRTLNTNNSELNKLLWTNAGYDEIPGVDDMIDGLSKYNYRFKL